MTDVSEIMGEIDEAALPPDDPMAPANSQVPVAAPVEVEDGEPFVPDGGGFLDKIKGLARRTPEEKQRANKERARTRNTSALEKLDPEDFARIILVPLLGLAMLATPKHLRANDQEIAAAADPIARIMLRHIKPLQKVGPDFLDCAMLLGVMVAYFRRVNSEREISGTRQNSPGGSVDHAPPPQAQMEAQQNGRILDLSLANGDTVDQYLGGVGR